MNKCNVESVYLDVKLNFLAFCLEDSTHLLSLFYFVGHSSQCLDDEETKQMTLELAELFLAEDIVQVGEGLDEDFLLWEGSPHELAERIKQKWDALNRPLEPHEIVYFIHTEKGRQEFEVLHSVRYLQEHDEDTEFTLLQKKRIQTAYFNVKLNLLARGKNGNVDLAGLNDIVAKFSYGENPEEIQRITIALLRVFLKERIIEARKIAGQWIDNPEAIVLHVHDNWRRLLSSPGAAHFEITPKGKAELKLFEGIPFLHLKTNSRR